MKRRSFLTAIGAASASVAGCLNESPTDAVVRAVEASPPEDVALVLYDNLPKQEQQIARTAVEEGLYHACAELPEVVWSFAKRFEGYEDTYLKYQNTIYGMYIRIEDTVRAGTASAPENEPICGIL